MDQRNYIYNFDAIDSVESINFKWRIKLSFLDKILAATEGLSNPSPEQLRWNRNSLAGSLHQKPRQIKTSHPAPRRPECGALAWRIGGTICNVSDLWEKQS